MEEKRNIKVGVFRCLCKICKRDFEVFRLSDFTYGERILLTEDGIYFAYLNCFEDSVYNSTDEIIKNIIGNSEQTNLQYRKCFDKLFSVTCDSINGKRIDASRINFACPACKSDNIQEIDSKAVKSKMVNLPVVSHDYWELKSDKEKNNIMHSILKLEGCISNE